MSTFRVSGRPASAWSRTGPTARLLAGAAVIAMIGLAGLTEKSLFGTPLPWPHAALWGAVGWGAVGLSFRLMAVLAVLGLAQDIAFTAPLGCFVLINLAVYGLSAAANDQVEIESDPLLVWLVPSALIAAGFGALWLVASSVAGHAVQVWPLLLSFLSTLGLYFLVANVFRLGRAPGRREGQRLRS